MILFDHIEVHVSNPENYCKFLISLFKGGRFSKISENGTFMFQTQDQIHLEIKQSTNSTIKLSGSKGFCMPCLRMENAYNHLSNLSLKITKELSNPDGPCYFFTDNEGIEWHIKSYIIQDCYINI
jgi:hypothetical protein